MNYRNLRQDYPQKDEGSCEFDSGIKFRILA